MPCSVSDISFLTEKGTENLEKGKKVFSLSVRFSNGLQHQRCEIVVGKIIRIENRPREEAEQSFLYLSDEIERMTK